MHDQKNTKKKKFQKQKLKIPTYTSHSSADAEKLCQSHVIVSCA
jgi:hypothetical protein